MTTNTNLIALKNDAREIQTNWETIDLLERQVTDKGTEWIREMALQGQRLIHVKTQLRHGDWLPWCEAHVGVPYQKVNQCMVIAANFTRVQNLQSSESLRQALLLCAHTAHVETKTEPRRWAPFIEANLKLTKYVGYVERFPVASWPSESQQAAREKLLPVVAALWPDKFA